MSDQRKRISSNPFTGKKKRKAWNKKPKTFESEKKENLAISDKGSYYNQGQWLEEYENGLYFDLESSEETDFSDDDLSESDYTSSDEESSDDNNDNEMFIQSQNKYKVPSSTFVIIDPSILQIMITERAQCKFCGGKLEIKEKVTACQSLGRVWTLTCGGNNCCSVKDTPMTPKHNQRFQLNESLVLACRLIGRGRAAARKLTSLLNLPQPISRDSWRKHTIRISKQFEELLEKNLENESLLVKKYLMNAGKIGTMADEELKKQVVKASVSVDGSWGARGWCSSSGIVDVCFEETGKVLEVIMKFSN